MKVEYQLKILKKGLIFKKFSHGEIVSSVSNSVYTLKKSKDKSTFLICYQENHHIRLESDGLFHLEFTAFDNSDYTKWNYQLDSPKELLKTTKTYNLNTSDSSIKIKETSTKITLINNGLTIGYITRKNKKRSYSEYIGICKDPIFEREVLLCLNILALKNDFFNYETE